MNATMTEYHRAMRQLRLTREREAREEAALNVYLDAKYNAEQPRVPAGHPGGGRWAATAEKVPASRPRMPVGAPAHKASSSGQDG